MKTISLVTHDGRALARNVRVADTFTARTVGWLRTRHVGPDEGVLLIPCASVHTLAMRVPIDVVFLDRRMRVLGLSSRLPPRRVRRGPTGAARVLVLAAGRIAAVALETGTYVLVERRELPRSAMPAAHTPRPAIQFSLRLPLRSLVESAAKTEGARDSPST